MLISMSNRNQPTIIELRGEPQKHREIRAVSTVTFGRQCLKGMSGLALGPCLYE
jgi:hypothetical protein